jgi:hypothetical protein
LNNAISESVNPEPIDTKAVPLGLGNSREPLLLFPPIQIGNGTVPFVATLLDAICIPFEKYFDTVSDVQFDIVNPVVPSGAGVKSLVTVLLLNDI